MMQPTPKRPLRHRVAFWLTALVTTTMLFSIPAHTCPEDEKLEMSDPVVSVVEGPGDLAQEQGRWSALSSVYIEAFFLEVYFDDQLFELGKVE